MGHQRGYEDRRALHGEPEEATPSRDRVMQARRQSAVATRAQSDEAVHEAARSGVSGSGGALPHQEAIQKAFGKHDVSNIGSHVGGRAAAAADTMGAQAYATGDQVAFRQAPDLHTAAHEAAHVVQQRAGVSLEGGVGQVGDRYEQHADQVADAVVAGRSAEAILDREAGDGGAQAGVQRKAVQFDIKSDLREAMDGWGTDEDGIHNRLARATVREARQVLADRALMGELRSELGHSDLRRVLDALNAPLADKLELAMDGWGTDEGYIHRSLLNASSAQLQSVAADSALVDRLHGELSGDDLRQVLDRLAVTLSQKLHYACKGWGTDEAYIYTSITNAPLDQVTAAAGNATLIAEVDGDLSGAEWHQFRGTMAKRLYLEAADHLLAFRMIAGADSARGQRLVWVGDVTVQRELLDKVVLDPAAPADHVVQAFESYWAIESGSVENAPEAWPADTVRAIHRQMKLLPDQDTRAGVWQQLILTGDPDLINRAAWNGRDLIVGANASTTGDTTYGHGTRLSAGAASGSQTLDVVEPDRFSAGDTIAVHHKDNPVAKDVADIQSISGTTYTLSAALTQTHYQNEWVVPDDATAMREVNWLDATVRHEIAHAVETAIGGVTGFTQGMGGWWTGDSFDSWATAMGTPWATNDGTVISDDDKKEIKDVIVDSMKGRKGSLFAQTGLAADHPVLTHAGKGVAVIEAAEACLSAGDGFHDQPQNLRRSNGKVFTISWWYKNFMYFNESVVAQRVNNYSLYAPAEFFAEAYTVFYEQAGAVPDEQLGQLIRVGAWREWIKNNIHNRGLAPAEDAEGGGAPSSAAVGRSANNPGA